MTIIFYLNKFASYLSELINKLFWLCIFFILLLLGAETNGLPADEMKCQICFELVECAIECVHCGQFFCGRHEPDLTNCPFCRSSPLNIRESRALRRLVDQLPVNCTFCKQRFTKGAIEIHRSHCAQRPPVCGVSGCGYETLNKEDAFSHFIESHGDILWAKYNTFTSSSW